MAGYNGVNLSRIKRDPAKLLGSAGARQLNR